MRKTALHFTLFLMYLTLPLMATAQVVDIPDPNLRAAIEDKLDKAPDDAITVADMQELSDLIVQSAIISDLTGLEFATYLDELDLSYNSISDISALSGLTELDALYLSYNSISDISALSGLTELDELYLFNNNISDISALSGLADLRELHLFNNSISDISALSGLTSLETLDLANNSISDLFPLVANTGFSDDTYYVHEISRIYVEGNPLNDTSVNTHLPTLRGRGIEELKQSKLVLPKSPPAAVGQTFTLNLNVNNVVHLAGWQLNLAFNPAVLKVLSVSEGDFLSKDDTSTFFAAGQIDNAAGSISGLGGAIIGNRQVTGSGTLLSITFEAKAAGEGGLRVSEDRMGASNGNEIHYDVVTPSVMVIVEPTYDLNGDGEINILDLTLVAQNLGKDNPKAEANRDGVVDVFDLIAVAQRLNNVPQAPGAGTKDFLAFGSNDRYSQQVNSYVNPSAVQRWISMAQAADDGSLAFKRGIANLKRLLATIVPDKTTLLANYPNPFNPETWIPYHLANDAEVQLTIYDARGALVRRLALGHQGAGYYTDQSRAAYWDGRNQRGDSVASGVYFYQLWTGDFSAMRKMVIVK